MSTTSERKGLVVTLAGLARAQSTDVGPMPLCESTGVAQPSDVVGRFRTAYAPLARNIQIGSTSVSPLSGETRQGALSFDVVLADRRYPEVARYLFAQPTTPIAELLQGTSFDAGDLTFTVRTSAQSLALGPYIDDVVYLRGMALRIEDVNGATNVVTVRNGRTNPAGGTYPTLATGAVGDLGHAMTYIEDAKARAFGAAPPYPDDEVWVVNPALRERPVLLYTSDGKAVERQIGIYLIDSVTLSDDATFARVSCLDVLSVLKDRQLNARALRMTVTSATLVPSDLDLPFFGGGSITTDQPAGPEGFVESVYGGNQHDAPVRDNAAVVQVDKSVFLLRDDDDGYGGFTVAEDRVSMKRLARNTVYRSDPPRNAEALLGKSAWEILVSIPWLARTRTNHPFYSDDLAAVAQHPLDLMQCHIGTIDSNLPPQWKTSFAPASWFDVAAIERIRDTVYPDVTAPGLFAGRDGKPIGAMEYLWESFVAMLAGDLAVNANGQITVRCVLDTAATGTTPITSSTLLVGRGKVTDMSRNFDRAIAKVGPGMDGTSGELRVWADVERNRYRYATEEFEFRCLAAWVGSVPFDPEDTRITTVTSILRRVAQWMRTLPYEHDLRVSGRYDVETGRTYQITGPGFRDAATGLVTPAYSFVGYVRERKVDPQTFEQDLRVIEMPAVTWIGMSCAVESIAGGDELTVDAPEFIEPLTSSVYEYAPGETIATAVAQIGVDLADGRTVQCVIVSRRGVPASQTFTVSSVDVGASTITASAAILAVGGGGYTHTAGDRVQLAEFTDTSDVDMRADYAWVTRDVYGL